MIGTVDPLKPCKFFFGLPAICTTYESITTWSLLSFLGHFRQATSNILLAEGLLSNRNLQNILYFVRFPTGKNLPVGKLAELLRPEYITDNIYILLKRTKNYLLKISTQDLNWCSLEKVSVTSPALSLITS